VREIHALFGLDKDKKGNGSGGGQD